MMATCRAKLSFKLLKIHFFNKNLFITFGIFESSLNFTQIFSVLVWVLKFVVSTIYLLQIQVDEEPASTTGIGVFKGAFCHSPLPPMRSLI